MTSKRHLHILRPAGLIGVGLLLAVGSAFLAPPAFGVTAGMGAFAQATPTPQAVSEVGSTDWITLASIIIVLIVITPILIRIKTWDR